MGITSVLKKQGNSGASLGQLVEKAAEMAAGYGFNGLLP